MARDTSERGTLPAKATSTDAETTSGSPSDSTNYSYSQEGDPNISRPVEVTASESTTNMNPNGPIAARVPAIDYSLLPGGSRSLSSIALHAFALGTALGLSVLSGFYLAYHDYRIWRLPEFIATLAIFHFLEFYTTSRWATVNAKVSSFLVFSNGAAYNVAHAAATSEILLSSYVFPGWQAKLSNPFTISLGLFLVVVGQTVRSVAMAQAGRSFNHIPQRKKREDHVLVTSGVYAYLRHPSYFGYYWFAVGTQIVVGNKICAVVYAVTLYLFFARRIPGES